MKDSADMRFTKVISPSANDRVDFVDHLFGGQRSFSPCPPSDLVLKMFYGPLPRIGVKTSCLSTAPYLVGPQSHHSISPLDLEAKELKPMAYIHNASFVRMKRYTQLLQDTFRRRQKRFCLSVASTSGDPIIRVPRDFVTTMPHFPIKRSQKDITQAGRNYPALRSSLLRRKTFPLGITSSLQYALNESQYSTVRNALVDESQQLLMRYGTKEVSQVRIHDPFASRLNLLPDFSQGILRRSSFAVSETGIIEYSLKDRLDPVQYRLLANPIVNRRNAKRAILSRL